MVGWIRETAPRWNDPLTVADAGGLPNRRALVATAAALTVSGCGSGEARSGSSHANVRLVAVGTPWRDGHPVYGLHVATLSSKGGLSGWDAGREHVNWESRPSRLTALGSRPSNEAWCRSIRLRPDHCAPCAGSTSRRTIPSGSPTAAACPLCSGRIEAAVSRAPDPGCAKRQSRRLPLPDWTDWSRSQPTAAASPRLGFASPARSQGRPSPLSTSTPGTQRW